MRVTPSPSSFDRNCRRTRSIPWTTASTDCAWPAESTARSRLSTTSRISASTSRRARSTSFEISRRSRSLASSNSLDACRYLRDVLLNQAGLSRRPALELFDVRRLQRGGRRFAVGGPFGIGRPPPAIDDLDGDVVFVGHFSRLVCRGPSPTTGQRYCRSCAAGRHARAASLLATLAASPIGACSGVGERQPALRSRALTQPAAGVLGWLIAEVQCAVLQARS